MVDGCKTVTRDYESLDTFKGELVSWKPREKVFFGLFCSER